MFGKFMLNKYNIIYADPPWPYNKRRNPDTKFGLGQHRSYPPMKFSEIEALPVASIADKNCALFLWTTGPKVIKQIQIPLQWGFRFCTKAFCWIKKNIHDDNLAFLPGYYTGSNTEDCYLYIKGRMSPVDNTVRQPAILPRMSPKVPHSSKPSVFRDRIVQLFGDLPRIELFARGTIDGWDTWGDESE